MRQGARSIAEAALNVSITILAWDEASPRTNFNSAATIPPFPVLVASDYSGAKIKLRENCRHNKKGEVMISRYPKIALVIY